MPRDLLMDGLDRLRDRLDGMATSLPGWQFQMIPAPAPAPMSAVMIQGWCPEIDKQAGLILLEEHIMDGDWDKMLLTMEESIARATYRVH